MAPRVLIADDDPDMRAAVAAMLVLDGMVVDEAGTGAEALTKLADGNVDLLVTDVMMPELNGMQAAAMARTAGAELPILVMTAHRDPWIAASVRKLQCTDLLYKPFTSEELVERTHRLLTRRDASPVSAVGRSEPHLFPPALVPVLRQSVGANELLASTTDELLTELLSTVFFAGLETEEGERHPVRVVLVTSAAVDAEPPMAGVPSPLFRWSTIHFETPRPLSVHELAKLAAASADSREYVQVSARDSQLVVTGLSREGVNLEGDQALKIIGERAGGFSIRIGRHHVLDYEHGRVQSSATSKLILSGGPVRRALEWTSAQSGLPAPAASRYVEVVRMLVAKLAAHGSGGILVFGAQSTAAPMGHGGYRTRADISLVAMLLRLHGLQSSSSSPTTREETALMAAALQTEIQLTMAELGAMTALDGATIIDASLALVGFGIVLPVVDPRAIVVEAEDLEAVTTHSFDLGSRGTRHRAAATYAWTHPGSVVFVASQDGDLGCLFRPPDAPSAILWRFRGSDLRA